MIIVGVTSAGVGRGRKVVIAPNGVAISVLSSCDKVAAAECSHRCGPYNHYLTRLRTPTSYHAMRPRLIQGNHKLTATAECQEAIAAAKEDEPVTIADDGKLLRFLDREGRLLGTVTKRHALAKEIEAGGTVVYSGIAWKYDASDRHPFGLCSARVAIGDPEDDQVQWYRANVWGKPREVAPPMAYPTNIVGESFYQAAIRRCQVGDTAILRRELGNPADPQAIVVQAADGAKLGYIARSHWLQRVVHVEGCGARATITGIHSGPPAAVILSVVVTGEELGTVAHTPD